MNERVSNIDSRDVCNNVNGEKSMNHSLITDEGKNTIYELAYNIKFRWYIL